MVARRSSLFRKAARELLVWTVSIAIMGGAVWWGPFEIRPAYAAQFARPDADIDTGVWVTAPLWSKLDDGSTGDDVYASGDGSPANTEPFSVQTANVTNPGVTTGHTLRAQWSKESTGGADFQGVLELRQGFVSEASPGTLIATLTGTVISGTTDVTDTYTLTAGEAGNITDYTNLQLRAWAQKVGGGPNRNFRIDFIELEVPDAPNVDQFAYRWRSDDGGETAGTSLVAENTAYTSLAKSTNIRLRFTINNTGGSVSQSYRLEYTTETGGTCDTSWTAVPDSPTTEHFDMVTTSNYADQDASTNVTSGPGVMTDPGGSTFTAGHLVESPSNTTNSITLALNRFTEIEFAFQANSNATGGQAYCLKVSNAGTALDSYTNTVRVTVAASGPTVDQVMRHGNFFSGETEQYFFWVD